MATSNIDSSIPLHVEAPDMFGRLNQVLAAKRQKQEVQQGAIDLNERKAVQSMLSSGQDDKGESILGDDGDPDPQKLIPAITRVAPTTGQQYIQAVQTTHSNKIGLQRAAGQLAGEQRDQVSGILRSAINDPNAKGADVSAALDAYAEQNPAAVGVVHYAQKLLGHLDGVAPDQKAKFLNRLAVELQPAGTTSAQQQPSVAGINTGPEIALTNTNPQAPGGVSVQGTLATDVAPQLNTNTAGQLTKVAPRGASVSVVPTAGASNANPSAPEVSNLTQGAKDDQTLYTEVKTSADRAPVMKNLLANITTLASETPTGKGSKEIADIEAAITQRIPGFKSTLDQATKRQLLGKYTAQLLLQAKVANGAATDQAQREVSAAIPDPDHMSPDAIRQAARLIQVQQNISQARGAIAERFKADHNGSTTGLQAVDSQFMQHVDPRVFDYVGIPKDDRKKFLASQFKDDADRKKFIDNLEIINHYGGFDYLKGAK